MDYCIQKGFPFLGGGWVGVGKGENRHFSLATRSVSCARFAHSLPKSSKRKNKKKKVWKKNWAQGCDFRFNSTRPRATSIVICSKFGIWRAFRKCLGSSVTERRCLIIDSKGENLKRLVVREINIVLSGAIPECERGRCQPNVVEIIALVTEARGRLTLLIVL